MESRMQKHGSKYFARRHRTSTLEIGSIGQKVNFFRQVHVVYQIKGNHEIQQHGRNMVETVHTSFFYWTNHWKLVDRLLHLICKMRKVNLGVGEMDFMICDL